jgi:hypothetical protein
MVTDTGKTLRADTLKPVNLPEAVQIEEDTKGLPLVLRSKRRQKIISIEDRWRIDDEWWRSEAVSRLYYAVLLASGQRVVLYKDLAQNTWHRQTI